MNQQPSPVVFIKAVVITAVSTYPFALLVSSLSEISVQKVSPCQNGNICTFVKLLETNHLPSTISFGLNPFVQIRNGDNSISGSSSFLPPLCPGYSVNEMTKLCALPDSIELIDNPMKGARSGTTYIIAISGWFAFKVLHDCLLMCKIDQYITVRIGIASVVFQMLAVATAFIWSMGAAGVFVAPLQDGACGCYYQLQDLQTLLALSTPALLYAICQAKLDAVQRAVVSGDYLYFMQYDVPHHLVAQSISDPSGSYLVDTTSGSQLTAGKPVLNQAQLRYLYDLLRSIYRYGDVVGLSGCVGLAIGPVVERLMELGTQHVDNTTQILAAWLAAASLFIYAVAVTYSYWNFIFDFESLRFRDQLWEWRTSVRLCFLSINVVGPIVIWCGASVLGSSLLKAGLRSPVEAKPSTALMWALAGLACFAFGMPAINYRVRYKTRLALAMKARVVWMPSDYRRALEYPEFDLHEQIELADRFLRDRESSSDSRSSGSDDLLDLWRLVLNSPAENHLG